MRKRTICCLIFAVLFGMGAVYGMIVASPADSVAVARPLPEPVLSGRMSVEEAIARRRSLRRFSDRTLSTEQIAQLCWSGQGIQLGHQACWSV